MIWVEAGYIFSIKFLSATNILFLSKEFSKTLFQEYTNYETRIRPDLKSKESKP